MIVLLDDKHWRHWKTKLCKVSTLYSDSHHKIVNNTIFIGLACSCIDLTHFQTADAVHIEINHSNCTAIAIQHWADHTKPLL